MAKPCCMYTYSKSTGFGTLNMLSFVGALGGLLFGYALIVYNILQHS
ncbi:hypothetical protein [Peribacillus butanolivorans]